jgi:hypothetical protein
MHIPLALAVLALLAFALLPVLDRTTGSEVNVNGPGPRAYWIRVARWVKE